MKGIVLAAGVASRLRPLTDNMPKCLLQIGRKTILQRTMDNLISNGIDEIIIVTGYLQAQILAYVAKVYPDLTVHFIYNKNFDSTNNIYSLWLAREQIDNDAIILLDSDIVFDKHIIQLLLESEHANCLAMRSAAEMDEEEMKVRISEDMRISEISKKIKPALAAGESMGIASFDESFVSELMKIVGRRVEQEGRVNDFYEAAFQEAISKGSALYAVDIGDAGCVEIDTAEDIEFTINKVVGALDAGE